MKVPKLNQSRFSIKPRNPRTHIINMHVDSNT